MAGQLRGGVPPLWAFGTVIVVAVLGYVGWYNVIRQDPWERQPLGACQQAMYAAAYGANLKHNETEQGRTLWECASYSEWSDALSFYPHAFAGASGDLERVDTLRVVRARCRDDAAASPVCRDLRDAGIFTYDN